MKFCKDCKWGNIPEHAAYWSKCNHPAATYLYDAKYVITGEKERAQHYCDFMRRDSNPCKEEGLLFEPKEVA